MNVSFNRRTFIEEPEFRFQYHLDKRAGTAKIDYIGVKPRYRRSGIGREIVRKFVDYCRKQGIELIKIDAYKRALKFWRALGFTIGERQKYGDDLQDYYTAFLGIKT